LRIFYDYTAVFGADDIPTGEAAVVQAVEPQLLLLRQGSAEDSSGSCGEFLYVLVLNKKCAGRAQIESVRYPTSVRVVNLPPEKLRWKITMHSFDKAVLVHECCLLLRVVFIDRLCVLVVFVRDPANPINVEVHELSPGFVGDGNRGQLPKTREPVAAFETNLAVPAAGDPELGAREVHDNRRTVELASLRIFDQQNVRVGLSDIVILRLLLLINRVLRVLVASESAKETTASITLTPHNVLVLEEQADDVHLFTVKVTREAVDELPRLCASNMLLAVLIHFVRHLLKQLDTRDGHVVTDVLVTKAGAVLNVSG
jgi:hypothetical protein